MQTVEPLTGFTETPGKDHVEFVVTPPPVGAGLRAFFGLMHAWTAFVLSFVLAVVVAFFFSTGWFVFWLVFMVGGLLIQRRFGKDAAAKAWMLATARIRVQREGIRLMRSGRPAVDRMYERGHVREIRVDGPPGDGSASAVSVSTLTAAGSGTVGAATAFAGAASEWGRQIGAAVGERMARQAMERASSIHLRYGAEDVVLVAALPHLVALELADRITAAFRARA